MFGQWNILPHAIGAIDGTSHHIVRPEEDQGTYYSGHRSLKVVCISGYSASMKVSIYNKNNVAMLVLLRIIVNDVKLVQAFVTLEALITRKEAKNNPLI